jgi:hypothetical protein
MPKTIPFGYAVTVKVAIIPTTVHITTLASGLDLFYLSLGNCPPRSACKMKVLRNQVAS